MKFNTLINKLNKFNYKLAEYGEDYSIYNLSGNRNDNRNAVSFTYDFKKTSTGEQANKILYIEKTDQTGEVIYFEDFTTKQKYFKF